LNNFVAIQNLASFLKYNIRAEPDIELNWKTKPVYDAINRRNTAYLLIIHFSFTCKSKHLLLQLEHCLTQLSI